VLGWGQVFSGVATAALLIGSGAGFTSWRVESEQAPKTGNRLAWGWRACTLAGFGALFLSVVLHGVNKETGLSTLGDWAAVVTLVAGLSSTGSRWRYLFRPAPFWLGRCYPCLIGPLIG
jgi:hypothetical protein